MALLGRKPGSPFYSLARFGAAKSERISNATAHAALKERCAGGRAPLHLSPRDPKRTGLTRLFASGADPYAVAGPAEHRTAEETQPYLPHRGGEDGAAEAALGQTALHRW